MSEYESIVHKKPSLSVGEYMRESVTDFGHELAQDVADAMVIAQRGIDDNHPAHALWGPLAAEVFREIRDERRRRKPMMRNILQ